jgi:ABC-2 type transport system permease protein
MFAPFVTEYLKLRRSLALLLCIAAPFMVAVLATVMLMDREQPSNWPAFTINMAAMWSFFMLPMTVTALTVLVAQLEHGPRFWNHLLALPVARWRIFAAKAGMLVLLVALMSVLLVALMPVAGFVAESLASGTQLKGNFDLGSAASLVGTMFAGSVLLIAIQLWAALRFRSFVPPLVIGIGGTFVAVAATGSRQGAFFPWLIPTNALATDPARADMAISIGLWGGVALLALMLVDLSRKEFA